MRPAHSHEASYTYPEEQDLMMPYKTTDHTSDFLDVLLPLALVLSFGMAAPLSVPLLLLVILVQTRTSAWKLVHCRRPYPTLCHGIEVFNKALQFFAYFMIVTNMGLIFFDYGGLARELPFLWSSMKWLPQFNRTAVVTTSFFLSCTVFALLWTAMDNILPTESKFVRHERRRQDKQKHHLLYHLGCRQQDLGLAVLEIDPDQPSEDFASVPTAERQGLQTHHQSSHASKTTQAS